MHASWWEIGAYCWCIGWGILGPIAWMTRKERPTSLADAWAMLPQMRGQVFQLPDGTLAKLKTGWEPVDPEKLPADAPVSTAPPRIVHGIQPAQ